MKGTCFLHKWFLGRKKEKLRKETVDYLQKYAVTKECTAWTDILRNRDSKAVWEKINWNATSEGNLTSSSKPPLEDLKIGRSVKDSTLLSQVTGDNYVPELDDEISLKKIKDATACLKEKSFGDGWTWQMLLNLPACLLLVL